MEPEAEDRVEDGRLVATCPNCGFSKTLDLDGAAQRELQRLDGAADVAARAEHFRGVFLELVDVVFAGSSWGRVARAAVQVATRGDARACELGAHFARRLMDIKEARP